MLGTLWLTLVLGGAGILHGEWHTSGAAASPHIACLSGRGHDQLLEAKDKLWLACCKELAIPDAVLLTNADLMECVKVLWEDVFSHSNCLKAWSLGNRICSLHQTRLLEAPGYRDCKTEADQVQVNRLGGMHRAQHST